MAKRKPVVVVNGENQQLQGSDYLVDGNGNPYVPLTFLTNAEVVTINPGEALYVSSSGFVKKAKADNATTAKVAYFAIESMAASQPGNVQSFGTLDNVLSGLVSGSDYFLSAATAGVITNTPPSTAGQFVVKVGKPCQSSVFEISIHPPIKLS